MCKVTIEVMSKVTYRHYNLSPASPALYNLLALPQARLRHRLGLALSPPASLAG